MVSKARAFIIVSIFLLLVEGIFILINYLSSREAFEKDLAARKVHLESTFFVSLFTVEDNMQQIATYIANEPAVQRLFLEGKKAVEKEGGGAGGPQAARVRDQLYNLVQAAWEKMIENYDVRQLHFHLGPGSLSFLRVHKPNKFGDRMDSVRYTIVDVNQYLQPVKGFETGRVYSGIRGVVPMFANDPESGRTVHVGALEAGTSLDTVLKNLRFATGFDVAALLRRDHLQKYVWPEFLQQQLQQEKFGEQLVLEDTSSVDLAIFTDKRVQDTTLSGGTVVLSDRDTPIAVMSIPFKDYRQSMIPGGHTVGYLVGWEDVSAELQVIQNKLRTNLLFGVAGFIFLELIFILAWRVGTENLKDVIRRKTADLKSSNNQLVKEVNERKLAEKRLRKSEELFRSAFMDNKAVMLLIDPETGALVHCNGSASAFYGYSPEELLTLKIWDLSVQSKEEIADQISKQNHKAGLERHSQHRLASGDIRDVVVYSSIIEQAEKSLVFEIIQDTTESRRQERARQMAEKRYQDIFQNAPVGIYRRSSDYDFFDVNTTFAGMLGYDSPEELLFFLDKDIRKIFLDEADYHKAHEILGRDGLLEGFECQILQKDGTAIWSSWNVRTILEGLDENKMWIDSFVIDITQQKKLEILKEDVERMIRHDLKGPLSGIVNLPELIRMRGALNEKQEKHLENIEQAGYRMSQMINMSLHLFKIETGTYQINPIELSVVPLLKRVLDELKGFAANSEVAVRLPELETGGSGNPGLTFSGEELLCFTMFQNLIKNAIEASPRGGVVTISIALSDRSLIEVRVNNAGMIPPSIQPVFFDKYTTSGKQQGTGLGTYSARLIARLHGGDIVIAESSEENGTSIVVCLPH